jgi:hypothetical protein
MIKLGLPGETHEVRKEDDDAFVMQGENYYGDDARSYMIGYNRAYANNIVIYENQLLKNLYCGMYALGYAVHHGYKNICLLGFDALQFDSGENVYNKQGLYTYSEHNEYGVRIIQQSQFVSLMEHINIEHPEVKVFFKNPIEGFDQIVYNELLSRFKVEDKWILGQGLESLI